MNMNKVCPQCGSQFEGRSNQLYCSAGCKQRAFKAGATHRAEASSAKAETERDDSDRYVTNPATAKMLETLRLQSAERMKRLDLEEREQEYERELEREEREFSRERERAQWERHNLKLQLSHQSVEGSPTPTPEKTAEDDEDSSGIGLGELALLGLGGVLVASLLKQIKITPLPPTPPPPKTLQDFAQELIARNRLKTDP